MGLAKGLRLGLAGLTGALQAGAEVVEEQQKTEDVYTLTAVKNSIAQRKAIAKEARKDYEDQRELQDKVSNYSGNVFGVDKSTGKERPLTPVEIEALITTIGEEDFKKYAMEKGGLTIKGGVKAIRTEVDLAESMEATAQEIKGLVGEGKGIAKGQEDRIAKKVENQLARLNLDTGKTKTTRTVYKDLEFSIARDNESEAKVNSSFITSGQYSGKDYKNLSVVQMNDGHMYINDPRVAKDGKLIPLPEELAGGVVQRTTRQEDITWGSEAEQLGREIASVHSDTKSFKALKEAANIAHSGLVGNRDVWNNISEYGLDPSIYGAGVTLFGSFVKRIETEIEAIDAVIDPNDDTDKDRSSQVTSANAFIKTNKNSTDAAVKAKVFKSQVFLAAVQKAQADGESRPSDMDIARRMDLFSASSIDEFYSKAEASYRDSQKKFDAAMGALKNPGSSSFYAELQRLKTSGEARQQGAAKYLESVYFAEFSTPDEGYVPTMLKGERVKSEVTTSSEGAQTISVQSPKNPDVKLDIVGDQVTVTYKGQTTNVSLDDAYKQGHIDETTYKRIKGNQ